MNSIKFTKNDVNIFTQNQGAENQLQANPYLNDGGQNIYGDTPSLLKYLCMVPRLDAKSKKMVSVDENLYPRKSINEDNKIKIDSYLTYVETMVNRN